MTDLNDLPKILFAHLHIGHYFVDCGDDGILPDECVQYYRKTSAHTGVDLDDNERRFHLDTFVIDLDEDLTSGT